MKCINNTCMCTSDQYYSNKCEDKKDYMKNCGSSATHCKLGLTCRDGFCKCSSGEYWSGIQCYSKRNYSQSCTSSEQCETNQKIYCDSVNLLCSCPSNR